MTNTPIYLQIFGIFGGLAIIAIVIWYYEREASTNPAREKRLMVVGMAIMALAILGMVALLFIGR